MGAGIVEKDGMLHIVLDGQQARDFENLACYHFLSALDKRAIQLGRKARRENKSTIEIERALR